MLQEGRKKKVGNFPKSFSDHLHHCLIALVICNEMKKKKKNQTKFNSRSIFKYYTM